MCGILGIFNTEKNEDIALVCLDKIKHRGPDGSGLVKEDNAILGHRRLSILDLSESGKQPMYYDNRFVITFNGEIYNFLEIRSELKSRGYSFKTDTDTEVIIASYIEWGDACVNKFNGMWAFAIYDRKLKQTFISRDRFGIKPLVYTFLNADKTEIAIASEMKALFPLMDKVEPNDSLIRDKARMYYCESGYECIIKNIYHFPKGSNGTITSHGLEIYQYWETLNNVPEVSDNYDEQVEQFRELFLDACKLRMRSDVTIGTALSGGLDSSATICAMKHLADKCNENRLNKDWQHAYIAAFPGTTLDETKYAKEVTDYLGIKNTNVVIDPSKAVDKFNDYIRMFEEIYITSPIPMMDLYKAVREDGTLVTIDGHGADELFGGYTFDFINALADAKNKEEKEMIFRAYYDSYPDDQSNFSISKESNKKIISDIKKRMIKKKVKGFLQGDKSFSNRNVKGDYLNRILYESSHKTILPILLRNYDHYSMANGVEVRMPFMDYRIVTFAFGIGYKSKIRNGYSKSIIRDAIAPYMPKSIAYRKTKIGFNTPIVEWMKTDMKEYFLDCVNSVDFLNCSLINPEEAKKKVENVIYNDKASYWQGENAFSEMYPYLWEKALIKNM